jgi:hypothetical protein
VPLAAAKLPNTPGDSTHRKHFVQTHATNPAVNASALAQPDLATSREQLEKLYAFGGNRAVSSAKIEHATEEALQDVEALLLDLQGLPAELESALELALEDFADLTVSSAASPHCNLRVAFAMRSFLYSRLNSLWNSFQEEDRVRLEEEREKQLSKLRNRAPRVRSSKPPRETRGGTRTTKSSRDTKSRARTLRLKGSAAVDTVDAEQAECMNALHSYEEKVMSTVLAGSNVTADSSASRRTMASGSSAPPTRKAAMARSSSLRRLGIPRATLDNNSTKMDA